PTPAGRRPASPRTCRPDTSAHGGRNVAVWYASPAGGQDRSSGARTARGIKQRRGSETPDGDPRPPDVPEPAPSPDPAPAPQPPPGSPDPGPRGARQAV